jgi:hypothetical protein
MTPEERLESALRSAEPARALRSLVLTLSQEGHAKTRIYQLLEELVAGLRSRDDYRESDGEVVLDVMDALTGWCHPDARLLPDDEPAGPPPKG